MPKKAATFGQSSKLQPADPPPPAGETAFSSPIQHLQQAIDCLAVYARTASDAAATRSVGNAASKIVWQVMNLLNRLMWYEKELNQPPGSAPNLEDFSSRAALNDCEHMSLGMVDFQKTEISFLEAVERIAQASSPVKIVAKRLGEHLRSRQAQKERSTTSYINYSGYLCGYMMRDDETDRLLVKTWFQQKSPKEEGQDEVVSALIQETGGDEGPEVEFEVFAESDDLKLNQWRQRLAFDPRLNSPMAVYFIEEPPVGADYCVVWVEAVHRGLNRHMQTIRLEMPVPRIRKATGRPKKTRT